MFNISEFISIFFNNKLKNFETKPYFSIKRCKHCTMKNKRNLGLLVLGAILIIALISSIILNFYVF